MVRAKRSLEGMVAIADRRRLEVATAVERDGASAVVVAVMRPATTGERATAPSASRTVIANLRSHACARDHRSVTRPFAAPAPASIHFTIGHPGGASQIAGNPHERNQ